MNQEEKNTLEEMIIALQVYRNKIRHYQEEESDWFLHNAGQHIEYAVSYLEKVIKDADSK